jgi:thioredoxin 1
LKKFAALLLMLLLGLVGTLGQAWCLEQAGAPPELPVKGMVTLVDVGAASCIPCKMMAPLLEELKREYQGKAAVHFVDVRYDKQAVDRFGIKGIPSQIFYDRQGKEAYRHLGFLDKQSMTTILNRLCAQ